MQAAIKASARAKRALSIPLIPFPLQSAQQPLPVPLQQRGHALAVAVEIKALQYPAEEACQGGDIAHSPLPGAQVLAQGGGPLLLLQQPQQPGGGRPVARTTVDPVVLRAKDPNFSVQAFLEKVANDYVQMQRCWQDKNWEPMRPLMTDALYSQFDRQLDELRRSGQTNYVERIALGPT